MPLYGSLKPGETEQMTFTFFGHTDVWGEAKAICEVEGGPSYEIVMMGEASFVEYRFDSMTIDFGKQVKNSCIHISSTWLCVIMLVCCHACWLISVLLCL